MVATKVLISLCVAQLAVAAPQLSLPGAVQRTAVNEGQIVTNVVAALQPSIAEAVARALASFQTTQTYSTTGNSAVGGSFSSQSGSSSAANSAVGVTRTSNSYNAAGNRVAATGGALGAANLAQEEVTTRPEYNFEFKVADENEQTYISQTEARDGDQLQGKYSYVDANGALVTVNYEAGPMGYTQVTDVQDGFVEVRAKPARSSSTATSSAASSAASSSSSSSRFAGSSASRFDGASGSVGGALTASRQTSSTTSAIDQSALVSQIVLALQPQIATSVNSALLAQQNAAAAASASRSSSVSTTQQITSNNRAASSSDVGALFGDGYNVRINTPEFNIEY